MDAIQQLSHALPPFLSSAASLDLETPTSSEALFGALEDEFRPAFEEAAAARACGVELDHAVNDDESWPALSAFHRGLKDALFVELPKPWISWIEAHQQPNGTTETLSSWTAMATWMQDLVQTARQPRVTEHPSLEEVQQDTSIAELILFEMVRLRLLLAAWSSTDYESVGGDERTVDAIAWREVDLALRADWMDASDINPGRVMAASAAVMLHADAADRALELEQAHDDTREHLRMQARLRHALRQLRLPESRLLENALANLLDTTRHDLLELQDRHPLALQNMTRQAMDQRVSRGRRALSLDASRWPARKAPALFDLFQGSDQN